MRAVYNPRRRLLQQAEVNNMQEHLVCDSACNILCEQVNLVVEMYPKMLSRTDQNITLTFVATHTGSQPVNVPIVIVSSLLPGTILLSNNGLNPGQTITVSRPYNISNMPFPSNSVTNVSYVALGNSIPGGYSPGDRLSKVITTTSEFHSSPTGSVSINSSGEIIDAGEGLSIVTMSFTVTSGSPVTSISVPLSGIFNISEGIVVIRNPSNMFQIINNSLVLAPGQMLNPGVRYVVAVEAVVNDQYPFCTSQSCSLTYTASSATSTNSNLIMVLNISNQSI